MFLDSLSPSPATSEIVKKCKIELVLRIYLPNLLVLQLSSTFSIKSVSMKDEAIKKQQLRNFQEAQAG